MNDIINRCSTIAVPGEAHPTQEMRELALPEGSGPRIDLQIELLKRLEKFVNRALDQEGILTLDKLTQLHAQFEAYNPVRKRSFCQNLWREVKDIAAPIAFFGKRIGIDDLSKGNSIEVIAAASAISIDFVAELAPDGEAFGINNISVDPGGTPTNVARALSHLCCDAASIGPIGQGMESVGDLYHGLMFCEGVDTSNYIPVQQDTSFHLLINVPGKAELRFIPPAPDLTAEEKKDFLKRFTEKIEASPDCRVLLTGSRPPFGAESGFAEELLPEIMRIAKKHGLLVAYDCKRDVVQNASLSDKILAACPDILKPNVDELSFLVMREGEDPAELRTALEADHYTLIARTRELMQRYELPMVLVSLAEEGSLLITGSHVLRARSVDLENATPFGAGDTLIAAFVSRLPRKDINSMTPDELLGALDFASAASTATAATPGTQIADLQQAYRFLLQLPPVEDLGFDFKDHLLFKDAEEVNSVLSTPETAQTAMDTLIYNGLFNSEETIRRSCRSAIRTVAGDLGISSASAYGIYEAQARGELEGRTLPAFNIRTMTYDTARALFRQAKESETQLFVVEISQPELADTGQSFDDYMTCLLAAAIREGYHHPIYAKFDHAKILPANYEADPAKEIERLYDAITDAIDASFCNIDIDASTIAEDPAKEPDVYKQQKLNIEVTAGLLMAARDYAAKASPGVTLAIGGEVGEVGKENTTVEQIECFLNGINAILERQGKSAGKHYEGLNIVSPQTGASHGGVILDDGNRAEVKIDFGTLEAISEVARKFGLAGAEQHGASTLPIESFPEFVKRKTAEIHLATSLMEAVFNDPALPDGFKELIARTVLTKYADLVAKPGMSEGAILKKGGRYACRDMIKAFYDLDENIKEAIRGSLSKMFAQYFEQLNVSGAAS